MVKVGILGLGSIGKHVSRLLLDHRQGHEIIGAVTLEAEFNGQPLAEVVGASEQSNVVIGDNLEELLALNPTIVVDASRSFLDVIEDDLCACLNAGANVVSSCEELAYPFARWPEIGRKIDNLARQEGVSVVGTGMNPGLIFDSLLLLATGAAWDIPYISGRRVVDVSKFSQNIHRRLGIGYTEGEFQAGHSDGSIAGHVGFPESIEIVIRAMGLKINGQVSEEFDPMFSKGETPTSYGTIGPGETTGFSQIATAQVGDREFIRLELILHLDPNSAGLAVGDSVNIEGSHPVYLRVEPGMDAVQGTSAQLVNSIPAVVAAEPGLLTVHNLPRTAAWLGAFEDIDNR
jgi:4-hydroxy-tetrahydrodipicolinate reductase